ncbi:MAG: O-antigen ligase family protein [Bacteroidetes bacterium]|nr:O-antigen ligase family protein [Bacteroidota bacterium]
MPENAELNLTQKCFTFLLFVLIPASFFPIISDNTLYPRYLLWSIASIFFVITVKDYLLPVKPFVISTNILLLLLILLSGYIFITSLLSRNAAESITVFLKFFLVLTTVFSFYHLFFTTSNFFSTAVKSITALCFLLDAIALWQVFNFDINLSDYNSIILVTSLNGNKNLYTEFLVISIPFCFLGLNNHSLWWRCFSLITNFLSLCAIVFLQSRGVWVAFFVMLIVFLFVINFKKFCKFHIVTGKMIFAISITLVVLFLSVNFINNTLRNSLLKRVHSIVNITENGSASGRLVLWQKTMNLIKENPIAGIGGNNWKIEFQQYGQSEITNIFNVRPMNDYVLAAAEWGIPGLLLYLSVFIYCIIALVKLLQREHDAKAKQNHIAVLCSLVAFIVVSFFSYTNERSENLIMLSFSLAYVGYYISTEGSHTNPASKAIRLVSLGILLFSTVFFFYKIKGEYFNYKIQTARKFQNHTDVINYADKAISSFYNVDETGTPIKWYSGVSKFILDRSDAISDFELAYAINPYHIHVLNNYATTLDKIGRQNEAIDIYKEAINISPKFNDAIFNLTVVYFNMGNFKEAYGTIIKWHGRKNENVFYVTSLLKSKLGIKLSKSDKKTLLRHQ